MELLLTGLAVWSAASLGLAAVWTAVVYAAPRAVRQDPSPAAFVPQPRPEYIDLTDDADDDAVRATAVPGASAEPVRS